MASPQSCPGLSDDIPRERPSCFAPLSPPSGPVLVDESVASGQRSTADWTTLDPRWMMKLQINSRYESQVIVTRIKSSWGPICCKPSKLLTVTGCRKYDSMTCRSIQRFCGAARQQAFAPSSPIWLSSQIDFCDGRVYLQCLGQGLEAATDQGWNFVRGSTVKTRSLKISRTIDIQVRNVESLWFKLGKAIQKSTFSFSIYHICWQLNSINLSLSEDVENMTSWHAAAFSDSAEPHHTPGLGALVANLVLVQSDVRDGRVYLQCLGQGLEAATDQGWRLVRGPFGQNLISEMLKKGHSTETCRISAIQNLEKQSRNPRLHSASTYSMTMYDIQLDWEYLTTQLDPRWTMKLQHLQHGQTSHCQRMSKTFHHDMPQHSAILRSPPHTRPWRPRRQSG